MFRFILIPKLIYVFMPFCFSGRTHLNIIYSLKIFIIIRVNNETDVCPEKHRRCSIRLKGYDYSRSGAYFVTICVKNKENPLGKIIDGEMILCEIGKISEKCWNEIPIHYPCVQLDKYVIMPNHIHGILKIIDNDYVWVENVGVKNVGAENLQPLHFSSPHYQPIHNRCL